MEKTDLEEHAMYKSGRRPQSKVSGMVAGYWDTESIRIQGFLNIMRTLYD